jgi:hypothetical protein
LSTNLWGLFALAVVLPIIEARQPTLVVQASG